MNMRFVTLSLAIAAGICFSASQLRAKEPPQPNEMTQGVLQPGDECGVDRAALEAWMICEEWMLYEETLAIDELIEPIVADENLTQESDECIADKCDGIVFEDEAAESEDVPLAVEPADEIFEAEAGADEETVPADCDEYAQIFKESAAEAPETTHEETFPNEELTGGSIWIVEFEAAIDEGQFAPEESIDEATVIEETVEAIESTEVEDDVEGLDAAIEVVISKDVTDDLKAEESADVDVTDAAAADEGFAEESEAVERSNIESADGEVATEETLEETIAATDDVASPVAVDAIEGASTVKEAVEQVEDTLVEPGVVDEDNIEEQVPDAVAINAYEDAFSDEVVDCEETLEVAEPLVEEAELQESVVEGTTADVVNEPEAGTIRTFELGGCKVTIESERQLSDFELLSMLWEAVDQLEAEMD